MKSHILLASAALTAACVAAPPTFKPRRIISDAKFLWAHAAGDVTGDGVADVVCITNNAKGGKLGYYQGRKTAGQWKFVTIAETPPGGGLFASGDMEIADIDGDGDLDVPGVKHPGEWEKAGAEAELFWYENAGGKWNPHRIGTAPSAVKDISFADFDNDGKTDIAILTFNTPGLTIYRQESPGDWKRVVSITGRKGLHEGMDSGDLNGDGFPDLVANGIAFLSPGKDLGAKWPEQVIDKRWSNQTGDWSRNATKALVRNSDGRPAVFISHSERAGYPVALYRPSGDGWEAAELVADLPACHTLQAADFDLDGKEDILAGVNPHRAVNLDVKVHPILLLLNQGGADSWERVVIGNGGIYNGRVVDYDGDGDPDILRYPGHEAGEMFLLENMTR